MGTLVFFALCLNIRKILEERQKSGKTATEKEKSPYWLQICNSKGGEDVYKRQATILKEVIRDSSVYNIRSVTVAEIMLRHAGWLAGAACLAGGADCEGPDLILLPEVPFDQDMFLARVDELQRVKSNVIIAASEGVKTADGTYPVSYTHLTSLSCSCSKGIQRLESPASSFIFISQARSPHHMVLM